MCNYEYNRKCRTRPVRPGVSPGAGDRRPDCNHGRRPGVGDRRPGCNCGRRPGVGGIGSGCNCGRRPGVGGRTDMITDYDRDLDYDQKPDYYGKPDPCKGDGVGGARRPCQTPKYKKPGC